MTVCSHRARRDDHQEKQRDDARDTVKNTHRHGRRRRRDLIIGATTGRRVRASSRTGVPRPTIAAQIRTSDRDIPIRHAIPRQHGFQHLAVRDGDHGEYGVVAEVAGQVAVAAGGAEEEDGFDVWFEGGDGFYEVGG